MESLSWNERCKNERRMLCVLAVLGTRLTATKMASAVHDLRPRRGRVAGVCDRSAPHREVLSQVSGVFGIRPDCSLQVIREDQRLAGGTAAVFLSPDPVQEREQSDWASVWGYTTPVMTPSRARSWRFGTIPRSACSLG
jgi:UDP-N-acetylglucosamine 2-epimerase (non-hydrolysing)